MVDDMLEQPWVQKNEGTVYENLDMSAESA